MLHAVHKVSQGIKRSTRRSFFFNALAKGLIDPGNLEKSDEKPVSVEHVVPPALVDTRGFDAGAAPHGLTHIHRLSVKSPPVVEGCGEVFQREMGF